MMATTPMGTAFFSIFSPSARTVSEMVSQTGSGRAATSRIPLAMPWIRLSFSISRSIMTSDTVPRAFSISARLAVRMASLASTSAFAMAARAAFFSSVESKATAVLAALARLSISSMIISP